MCEDDDTVFFIPIIHYKDGFVRVGLNWRSFDACKKSAERLSQNPLVDFVEVKEMLGSEYEGWL